MSFCTVQGLGLAADFFGDGLSVNMDMGSTKLEGYLCIGLWGHEAQQDTSLQLNICIQTKHQRPKLQFPKYLLVAIPLLEESVGPPCKSHILESTRFCTPKSARVHPATAAARTDSLKSVFLKTGVCWGPMVCGTKGAYKGHP